LKSAGHATAKLGFGGTKIMKKVTVIGGVLLVVVILTTPILAAQQEGIQQIKQTVTKKARAVAAHAGVRYIGQLRFVAIQETSISYATNTPQEVINFGNNFYLNEQEVWLVSPNAQGPWRAAPYVPNVVMAIVCSQLNADPLDPYQLCALPWASGLSDTVWKPS
jgi:hypothetical protein